MLGHEVEHPRGQLVMVHTRVPRGVDMHGGRPYAIRYFDVGADPVSTAPRLQEYLDKRLGASYFNSDKADLRWNHYLYFVTDAERDEAFLKAQRVIESDREYARKFVVAESELDRLLAQVSFAEDLAAGLPPDALSVWTDLLEQHRLGFIVDENLKVPTIVRHIEAGEPQVLLRAPTAPRIGDADRAVADDVLLERSQSILVSLQQRLRASARELMEHTHDGTHCPLCGAEYAEAELESRLNDAVRGAANDESDRLRAQLHDAEAVRERSVSEHRALEVLQRHTRPDDARATVESAVRAVAADREQLAAAQVELTATRTALEMHERKGWTFTRFVELSTATGLGEPPTVESLEAARAVARAEQQQVIEEIEKIDTDSAKTRAQLSEVGARFGMDGATGADLLKTISLHKRTADERREAIKQLGSVLDLQQKAVGEIETRLREAQDVAVRLRTALAREAKDSDEITAESKALADAAAEIAGLQVKLERVDGADAVIQDLLSHHSERALAETVLRENAVRIATTFAKIHAPNEFEVRTEDGFKVVRRGGGAVGLEEMSSGQRAAYALSLFLAMNERLRTGPKVILFDDPVAHVDDINILSLFDHLRDIALTGQRQIFFATADAKIAGLFGRKCRFLGEEFKQIELTRDDAS